MTRMTRPDCAVMCNLINIHTHTHTLPPREDQCEWHRMTRMTGPDCVVMCNLINTHTHTPYACSSLGLQKSSQNIDAVSHTTIVIQLGAQKHGNHKISAVNQQQRYTVQITSVTSQYGIPRCGNPQRDIHLSEPWIF